MPIVNIISRSREVSGGDTILLTATAAAENGGGILTYSWSVFGGFGSFSNPRILRPTWTAPPSVAQPRAVSIQLSVIETWQVIDPELGEITKTKEVIASVVMIVRSTSANQPPTARWANSVPPNNSYVAANQRYTLRTEVSDPENQPLTFSWIGIGEFDPDRRVQSPIWRAPRAIPSQDRICVLTLIVTDNGGLKARIKRTFKVRKTPLPIPGANQPPTITMTSENQTVVAGDTIDLIASVTDPEGDNFKTYWVGLGTFGNNRTKPTTKWTAPNITTESQDFELTLHATDVHNNTTSKSIVITVRKRTVTAPRIKILTPSQFVDGGGRVNIQAQVTNPSGVAGLRWDWRAKQGTIANRAAIQTTWTAPAATTNEVPVHVRIDLYNSDNVSIDSATVIFTVRATTGASGVNIITPNQTVAGGQTLTLEAEVPNPAWDIYRWYALVGRFNRNDRLTVEWTAPEATEHDQIVTISLYAGNSGNQRLGSDFITIVVSGRGTSGDDNALPIVVIDTPNQVIESGESLNLVARAWDTDGVIDTENIQWSARDGAGSFSDDSALNTTWIAPELTETEAFTLRLTVVDNDGGQSNAFVVITVRGEGGTTPGPGTGTGDDTDLEPRLNDPTVAITTPSQVVNGGQTVNLSAVATSPNGAISRYQWSTYYGEFSSHSGQNTVWTAPAAIVRNQKVVIQVTVVDVAGRFASDYVTMVVRGEGVEVPAAIQVPVPEAVRIIDLRVGINLPGQVLHTSTYTGDELVVNRGVGRLIGSLTIGEVDTVEAARAINGWLTALSDNARYSEVSHHRATLIGLNNTINSMRWDRSRLIAVLSGPEENLDLGYFLRIERKTYVVSEKLSNNEFVFNPNQVLPIGSRLQGALTIRIKKRGQDFLDLARNPDWHGPWTIDWIEL